MKKILPPSICGGALLFVCLLVCWFVGFFIVEIVCIWWHLVNVARKGGEGCTFFLFERELICLDGRRRERGEK